MEIDYSILSDGFETDKSHWTGYWHVLSKKCNDDGDYQFCLHENETGADELCEFLNQLISDNKELYDENRKYEQKISDVLKAMREVFIEFSYHNYAKCIENIADEFGVELK